MSAARKKIADLLWMSVPSADDDQARRTTERYLDAYRAEVLREAAEKIREVNRAATGTGSHATVVALRSHGDRLADVIDPL